MAKIEGRVQQLGRLFRPYHGQRMAIEIDIARVARLARLALTESQLELYRLQLSVILDHAARMQALPTEGKVPTGHPLKFATTYRVDQIGVVLDRDEVLSQAPETEGPFFRVPQILGEE